MDPHKITGPQDYQTFYHTSSEGLVWLDGKGNPIPLSHTLGVHVEAINPAELWNSIQMRSRVHKPNITALGHGPTNSTTIDTNTPLMTTPTNPILEHHVEVSQLEGSSMVTVKELLEDHHIQPGMMRSALSAVTLMFTPSKLTLSTENNDPIAPNEVPVSFTPNNIETPDINRELNTYKDRLALELHNFKKRLKMQSRIEVECVKQNLKSEFDHELQHQTLTHTEMINALRQQIDQLGVQLHQQQAATHPVLPQAPPLQDMTLPPPPSLHHYNQNISPSNGSLVEVMDVLNRSMINQNAILQETLRQSQSASNEHYLSNALSFDGKNQ